MWRYKNNIVAIHAALVVCAFAWLWGGLRGPMLVPVMPWLVAILAEVMLCFPERHGADESTYQARERVWKAMRRDPLVWVEVGFLALLLIPFGNNGLCPTCDAAAIAQGANPNPVAHFLPFCVNRLNHLSVFLWFLPTMTAVTAVKHSLTKFGKRLFCEMIVWNAAALAVLGFVQQIVGAPGPLWWNPGVAQGKVYFFSTFGYPNAGGAFFASCFALSVALWRHHTDEVTIAYQVELKRRVVSKHHLFWCKHYMAIPSLLTFAAALNTLSRAAIILASSAALVMLVHAVMCTLARLSKAQRVKTSAKMALALVVLAFLVTVFMPRNVRNEVGTIRSSNEMLDRVTGRSEYHSRVAIDLFWDNPFFGCGGWGYAHLSPTKMTEEELATRKSRFSPGSANVHNDYLQFLAEHGAVGFGCLVAIAVMLLIPPCKTWKRMARALRFSTSKQRLPPPRVLFVLPGGAFCVLVAVLVVLIHAFGDCPLRSPAVLSLLFCEFAALDGFLPHVKNEGEGDGK